MRIPTEADITPKHVWNPLSKDYETTIADETNTPQKYVVPAMQIATFPTWIADRIIQRLAQYLVLNRSEWPKKAYDDEFQKAVVEITTIDL